MALLVNVLCHAVLQSTYGFTNATAEMMVNDYTRKGEQGEAMTPG